MAVLALLSGAMGSLRIPSYRGPVEPPPEPIDRDPPDPSRRDNPDGTFTYCCDRAYMFRGQHADCLGLPPSPRPPVEPTEEEKLVAAKKAKRQALEQKRKKRRR